MKQRSPKHCKGCGHWHKAGHPKGSALAGSKYDNWCCRFGTHAPKAVSVCITQGENRNDRRNTYE